MHSGLYKDKFYCPICHRPILKEIPENPTVHNWPVYCKNCHVSHYPEIDDGYELGCDDPPFVTGGMR